MVVLPWEGRMVSKLYYSFLTHYVCYLKVNRDLLNSLKMKTYTFKMTKNLNMHFQKKKSDKGKNPEKKSEIGKIRVLSFCTLF